MNILNEIRHLMNEISYPVQEIFRKIKINPRPPFFNSCAFQLFLCWLLYTTVTSDTLLAQIPTFKNYSTREGLPGMMTYRILQDQNGYLWIGTNRGVVCYDGKAFKNFSKKDGLPGIDAIQLFIDTKQRVWCTFYNGSVCFIHENQVYNDSIYPQFSKLCRGNFISSFLEDSEGNFWFSSYSHTKQNAITKMTSDFRTKIIDYQIRTVYYLWEDATQRIWMANNDGYHTVEGDMSLASFRSNSKVFPRFTQFKDTIYSVDQRGIVQFDLASEKVIFKGLGEFSLGGFHFLDVQSEEVLLTGGKGALLISKNGTNWNISDHILPNHEVSSLLKDREGSYWFTTLDAGLFWTRSLRVKSFTTQQGLPNTEAFCIKLNSTGIAFAGFNDGKYVRIIGKEIKVNSVDVISSSRKRIKYCAVDNDKDLWFLTDFSIFSPENNDQIIIPYPGYSLEHYNRDTLLISHSNGTYFFKKSMLIGQKNESKVIAHENLLEERIFSTLTINKKDIWLGTLYGLKRRLENKIIDYSTKNLALQNKINQIKKDPSNTIWVATNGGGLVRIKDDSISVFDESEGMPSAYCSAIYVDGDSLLWVGTDRGLAKIATTKSEQISINTLDTKNGLISSNINDIDMRSDTFWLASKEGITVASRKDLKLNKTRPIINITGIFVNGTSIDKATANLQIEYGSSIEFEFIAVHFKSDEKISYQYQLEGLDDEWLTTKNNSLRYSIIPSGHYNFKLKGISAQGTESQILMFPNLIVLPPFWRSIWFILLTFVSLGLLIYWFFKVRIFIYNRDVVRELIKLIIIRLKRERFIVVKVNGVLEKISLKRILFVKSAKQYVEIITRERKFLVLMRLKEIREKFPREEFIQIHRSYIVNRTKIQAISSDNLVIKDIQIPIGDKFQDNTIPLRKFLQKFEL